MSRKRRRAPAECDVEQTASVETTQRPLQSDSDKEASETSCSSRQIKRQRGRRNTSRAAEKSKSAESGQVDGEEAPSETLHVKTTQSKRQRGSTLVKGAERSMQSADSEQDSDEEASETESDVSTDGEAEFVPEPESSDDSGESEEDTEEDTQEMLDLSDQEWKSKNKQIVWSPSHAETLPYTPPPCKSPGPTKYAVARITTVKSCFDLFITEEMKQYVLDQTNQQGRRSVKDWKDVDVTELDAFIGLLILAGVYKSRNELTRKLWDEHTGRAIFRATMPYGRYLLISANLRFEKKATQSEHKTRDKLGPIRTIWDKWSGRLPLLFNPGRDVCVDKQLLVFTGRCGFRQYIPRKPVKYGMKIWVTCDVATSYAWRMQIHTGEDADGANQGQNVVLDMTKGLKGNTVTCDHFFTSYALAEELLKKKLTLVGTIRKSKAELPRQLLKMKQRAPLSSLFAFTKTHTLVSYMQRPMKNVLLLSTKHREPAVSNKDHKQPTIVLDYNRCKGSVDNLDRCVSIYSCKRRCRRWPLFLFYNMLDVSAHNAYVLWSATDPSRSKSRTSQRRLFLEELGKVLVSENMFRRSRLPKVPDAAALVTDLRVYAAPLESEDLDTETRRLRKWCNYCTASKDSRKKTATTCKTCSNHICKLHTYPVCIPCYRGGRTDS